MNKISIKRIISCIVTIIILITSIPSVPAKAEETGNAQISINPVDVQPGDIFNVDVNLKNNPGLVSANLKVSFDKNLTLVGAENGDVFPSTITFIKPKQLETIGKITSSCQFTWSGFDIADKDIKDGSLITLRFEVSTEAETGAEYKINVTGGEGEVIDKNLNSVILSAEGIVSIMEYNPGDVNDDGNINMLDTVLLSRYVVDGCKYDPDGYAVKINENAANVNDDDSINMLDVVLLSRFIADGCEYIPAPDGYGVTLTKKTKKCQHIMEVTEKKAATCTEDGNIEYWYCALCDNYFSDSGAKNAISLSDTVEKAKGHQVVIDKGYPAEVGKAGLTDGSHCSVCGKTIVEQQPISPIEDEKYSIVYHPYDNDNYLMNVSVPNANPQTYAVGSTLKLKNPKVAGYVFDGWYDAEGKSGQLVREIPANSVEKGEIIDLYAKWSLVEYEVTFDSPEVPVAKIPFTVNKSLPLNNISYEGYTFVGWSINEEVINPKTNDVYSNNGKIITEIPKGTAEDVTVHANWTSNRNLTRPVSRLDDPVLIEDQDNNQLYFTYKIGTIENVPIYNISNLLNSVGLTYVIETDVSEKISTTTGQTIADAITNATSSSMSVTLGEDWNEVIEKTDEAGEEFTHTQGRIEETGEITGEKYFVSNSEGMNYSSTTSNGGSSSFSAKITDTTSSGLSTASSEQVSNIKDVSKSTQKTTTDVETEKENIDFKNSTNIGGSTQLSTSAEAKIGYGILSAGLSAEAKSETHWDNNTSLEIAGEKTHSLTVVNDEISKYNETNSSSREYGVNTTQNKSHGTETNSVNESHYDMSATSESSWNTSEGQESSRELSRNETVQDAISQLVYNKWKVTSSYGTGGHKDETTNSTTAVDNTHEVSSSVEYTDETIVTKKQTLTNTNSNPGYYRVVRAGTVHVFAVVGFDIASQSFYTSTYSILDGESTKPFIDYSRYSSEFNDCENGVISFEIPLDLYRYTTRVMMRSDGLKINYDTGIVEDYTGSATHVVIPEYARYYNETLDKNIVTKVKGISSTAFKGKNIEGIVLPDYITEIPEGAFENCTSLESVISYGVAKIGANAFKGCTSLKHYSVDRYVDELGVNAFDGVESIDVEAANKDVVIAAIDSGAKRLKLNVANVKDLPEVINVEDKGMDYFALIGNSKREYKNVQIKSDAKETVIGNLVLKDNCDTPIVLSSEKVSLNSVVVSGTPGFALILKNAETTLYIDGINSLNSDSSNTILAKRLSIAEQDSGSVGKMNVKGNVLVCDSNLVGLDLLDISDGTLQIINDEQYNNFLTSKNVVFDVNEGKDIGELESKKRVVYGQQYGEMPIPTRDNYTFVGWFTEKEGGKEVTASTIVTTLNDETLYAHWTANEFTVTFDANGGSVAVTSKEITFGESIGTLPTATKDYNNFIGWFTKADDTGVQVFETYEPESDEDIILYAHWSTKPTSDWVRKTQMPDGAQITNTKFTYIKRNYTSSSSSNLDGWIKYDTKQTDWGGTQGPVYSDPSNGVRNVWTEQYVVSSNTKRMYHYYSYRSVNADTGGDASYQKYSNCIYYRQINLDYELPYKGSLKNNYVYKGYWYWPCDPYITDEWVSDNYGTRWYFRDPVYTYYYYRDENKESGTSPIESDIRDVIEWVKYIEK